MFFRKKTYSSGTSPGHLAYKRFKKNKLALFFFFFIVLAIFVSILGYLITPDKTPYANEQMLEFSAVNPFSKVNILLVSKNEETDKTGFFKKMFFGKRNNFSIEPYDTYEFVEDRIELKLFTDIDTSLYISKTYKLADVIYPLSLENKGYLYEGDKVFFTDLNGSMHETNVKSMQQLILKKHLKSKRFYLGSDRFGRDVLSQLIIGTRVSLSVGFISVFISLLIGIFLGAIAGYYKGWIDNLIVWFINVIWSIPTLLLVIAITFALGKGFWQIFIAVGLTMWVEVARVVRGQVLSVREKEYVEATKALGYKNFRIIFRHILPNVISPVIVISAANFASAILIEAGLSFLGIGVQPPMPSWGTMIKEHYSYIILDKAHLALLPGIAIMVMVMAFMIIGNALRDALDVKEVGK